MDMERMIKKAAKKCVAKNGLCLVADCILPGSSLAVRGAFRVAGLLGAGGALGAAAVLGAEDSIEAAFEIGCIEKAITGTIKEGAEEVLYNLL